MTSKGRNSIVTPGDSRPQGDRDGTPVGDRVFPGNGVENARSKITQREVASYVEGMAASVRIMAQSAELDSLAYFLEMARLEAAIQRDRFARPDFGKSKTIDL